ncbi:MAG: chloride channel protein, partial [Candidatus Gastranaerophilales bacterium]|nr:chloride channel protein [Candidatus Gastranaerophilales bacterium]
MGKQFFENAENFLLKITRSEIIIQAILVGLISGILVVLFKISIESFEGFLRIHVGNKAFLPLIGALGGLIAGLLVYKIAPETKGSGIPYVKLTLSRIGKGTRLRSILVKFFAGVVVIGTGLSLGRECLSVQL